MGSKIYPDLVQSKLFFELVNEAFIDVKVDDEEAFQVAIGVKATEKAI